MRRYLKPWAFFQLSANYLGRRLNQLLSLCLLLLAPLSFALEQEDQTFLYIKQFQFEDFVAVDEISEAKLRRQLQHHLKQQLELGAIKLRGPNEYELSLAQCHQLADALTLYMRQQGLQFHLAYIAPQSFSQQRLNIRFVGGFLQQVNLIGEIPAEKSKLQQNFSHLIDQPLRRQKTETSLLLLQEYPGFNSFAFYSRGQTPGGANLNIKFKRSKRVDGQLLADNYGTETTGQYRLLSSINLYRPLGLNDKLQLGLLQAFEPDNSRYGWLHYQALLSPRWHWSLELANNQFDLASSFDALAIEGDVLSTSLSLGVKLQRRHTSKQDLTLKLQQQSFEQSSATLSDVSLLNQTHQALGFDYQWRYRARGFAQRLGLTVQQINWDEGAVDDEQPQRVQLGYSALLALGHSRRWYQSTLQLSLSGQYSEHILPALLRQGSSSSSGLRAVEPGLFAADKRALVRMDWVLNGHGATGKGLQIKPYVFADAIYAQQFYQTQAESLATKTLIGDDYGVGLMLQFGPHAKLNISYGLGGQLEQRQSGERKDLNQVDTNHILAQFNYRWGV